MFKVMQKTGNGYQPAEVSKTANAKSTTPKSAGLDSLWNHSIFIFN
jgi:hypothetical protein